MTITSNVHVGLTAWSSSTFTLGQRCSNSGNAYQCITAGSSTSAPTGTGASINNGGVAVFKWLSAIDYTTWQAWADALPATLSQPVIMQPWNNGPINATLGATLLWLHGHATTPTNNITIRPAPGESFRDQPIGTALNYDTTKGVAVQLPMGNGSINYLVLTDNNITIDGIQFQDPDSASASTILQSDSANLRIRNCIFDGYAQSGGADIVNPTATNYIIDNCLFIDRSASPGAATCIFGTSGTTTTAKIVNCTGYFPAGGNTNGGFQFANNTNANGTVVKNCAMFGWSFPLNAGGANVVSGDHCCSDATADFGGFVSDGGGNLFGKSAANQFISTTNNFRLKAGADCINAGVTDTTDIPTGDDIGGQGRLTWDIGANEYVLLPTAADSFMVLSCVASASQSVITNSSSATNSIEVLSCVAAAQQFDQASAANTIEALTAIGVGNSFTNASVTRSIEVLSAVASAQQFDRASATVSFMAMAATGQFGNPASAVNSIEVLSATAAAQQFDRAHGSAYMGVLACTASMMSFTNASATVSFMPIASASTAQLIQPANGSATIEVLSAVAAATHPDAATCLASFMVMGVNSHVTQQISKNNIDWRCVASAVPNLLFVGSANIDWSFIIALGQSSGLTTSPTIMALSPNAHANLFDRASLTSTSIMVLSAKGIIGNSAATRQSFFPLLAVGHASLTNNATAVGSLMPMAVNRVTQPLLKAENGIFLAAEDGTLLRADVYSANMGQSDACNAAVTLGTLTAAGSVAGAKMASAAVSFAALASVTSLGQSNPVAGLASIPTLACSGVLGVKAVGLATLAALAVQRPVGPLLAAENGILLAAEDGTLLRADAQLPNLNQSDQAGGTIGFAVLACSSTALKALVATSRQTLAALAASVALGQADPAAGLATLPGLTAATLAGQSNLCSGGGSIFLTCFAFALGLRTATGAAHIDLTASGVVVQQDQASATGTLPNLTAAGTVANGPVVQAVNNIDLGVAAAAALTQPASGINTVEALAVAASASLTDGCSATNGVLGLSCVASAQQVDQASALASIPITGSATAVLSINAAGTGTIEAISLGGSLVVNGAACRGVANIDFTARGTGAQFSTASVLAELEFLVLSHAKLYKSPIGYVEGEDVVYWPD